MKKRFYFQFIFLVFGLFCFSNFLNAQIEDIKVGTTTRKMLVYAPSDIVPNRPLLLSLHGLNQDIAYQQNQTKWELIAKENNFVVVYPAGINNSWDLSGRTDVDFILAIIDEMSKRYAIDRDRVYLSGFSMGGMMTYYAANFIADKIAAFAPVSGYLMGGPNTKSSRPIPIIHTHGTTDDVVAYSGVKTCLDAWIKRNNCPATAITTKPYPANKPNSNGTKYYWGPGTDSVEVVLISLTGNGHWHSIDPNGVNTSQEIWDFCKKYALGFGVPKFKAALVNDANPNQILVTFSKPLKELTKIEGFTAMIDEQDAEIDTVIMTDSVHLSINLVNSVTKTSEIQLSYSNGNVVSVYDKPLVAFSDTLVDNQLFGSAPKALAFVINEKGDSLIASFNKKMLLPSNISALKLTADFNGEKNVALMSCSFYKNDSTMLVFPLADTVYADYKLSLSYTGNTIVSFDSGLFKTDTAIMIENKAHGLAVHIVSASLDETAISVSLEFSKPMAMKDSQIQQLSLKVNGKSVAIKEIFNLKNTIRLNLFSNLYYGDTISVSYTPGNIAASDKGALDTIADFVVENPLTAPTYTEVPGKVEAENFTMQQGIATETTSDAGGGLNVGWTEPGDWLVWAIENTTEDVDYKILFRLAAQSAGPKFDYYIDNVKIDQVSVPSTGAWQTFKSVVKDITVPKGKHYFKIVTVTGGFNINFFEVQKDFVGIKKSTTDNISVYANSAMAGLVIKSTGFQYNKVQILDIMGRTVFNKNIAYQPELNLLVDLKSGIYMVQLSNSSSSFFRKVNVIK